MKEESKRATAAAVAQSSSPLRVYRQVSPQASRINEIVGGLLLGLGSPHLTLVERTGVLTVVDQLIPLKVDLGLLMGRRRSAGHDSCQIPLDF